MVVVWLCVGEGGEVFYWFRMCEDKDQIDTLSWVYMQLCLMQSQIYIKSWIKRNGSVAVT